MVKIRYLLFLLIILFGVIGTTNSFAHPIDNSDTYVYIYEEIDNTKIDDNKLTLYVYMNWFQAGLLVENLEQTTVDNITELLEYQDLYDNYILDKIKIINNNELCIGKILPSPISDEQLSLSLGGRSILEYTCDSTLENIEIQNELFLEYYELPSNYTQVYFGPELLLKTTLGRDRLSLAFNADELVKNPVGDDSMDYTENLSEHQIAIFDSNVSNTEQKSRSILQNISDTLFLRTENIKNQSITVTLLIVFLLGIFHTLEAGHSKAILASVMINNKMSFKGGVLYASIFTATHVADIILLGIVFFVADQFFDIYSRFTVLENLAAVMLLFISLYILIKNIREYLKITKTSTTKAKYSHVLLNEKDSSDLMHTHDHKHEAEHTHEYNPNKSYKEQVSMAVLTGLAPCLFGWSIFMIILSSKELWTIFPIILAFGAGIFCSLLIVVFIIDKLRKPAFNKFSKFATISPVISGILLVAYSILLLSSLN